MSQLLLNEYECSDFTSEINRLKAENEMLKKASTKNVEKVLALKREVERLENRFGLVWPHQKEHFLKVVSGTEIVYKNKLWLKSGKVTSSKGSKAEVEFDDGDLHSLVRSNEPYLYTDKASNKEYLCHGGHAYTLFKDIVGKYLPTLVPKSGGDKEWGFDDKNGERKHILIEGDNYHALQVLQHTHRGAVDVIYIDPPYNTGNKDFKYNDRFVSDEDGSRHSSWLSFMERRLVLAKSLLSKSGLVFISIDDNESHRLKLLCDKVFGEKNFISSMPRKTVAHIRKVADYEIQNISDNILVYANQKLNVSLNKIVNGQKTYPFQDEVGMYEHKPFQNSGENGTRRARPNLYYPIYYNAVTKEMSLEGGEGFVTILPKKVKGEDGRWLWSKKKFLEDSHLLEVKNGVIKRKSYFNEKEDQNKYQSEKNWLDSHENRYGTLSLKKLGLDGKFDYPKPICLLVRLLKLGSKKDSIILDFFSGSASTGHAVWELNKEDGGNRQVILCTNNESNICEDVTYERMRRCNLPEHGNYQEGLEYLQVRHVSADEFRQADRAKSLDHIKHIINLRHNASKVIEDNDKWYATNTICVLKSSRHVDEFFEKFKSHSAFALVDNKSTKFQIFKERAASYGISPDKLHWLSKEYISDLLLSASVED